MNRKDFFKKLGLGAMAVIVAPKVLAETKVDETKYIVGGDPISEGNSKMGYIVDVRHYPFTPEDCYPLPVKNGFLRVKRSGFYCIGDVFTVFGMKWVATHYDGEYLYCIPQ